MHTRPTTRGRRRARRMALIGAVATAALAAPSAAGAFTVYSNDFSAGAGPSFSNQSLSVAPRTSGASGADAFSGQFGNETQTLTVESLPAHTSVTVSYDLLVLDSWDGKQADVGPDRFTEAIGDAGAQQTTLDTTFSNHPDFRQDFPQSFGKGDNPRYTGAAESDTIVNHTFFGSSVYRMTRTVPHTASTLTATFTAAGLQDLTDESWGIDNVKVEAVDDPDGDGFADGDDRCPTQTGTVRGCPVPASTTTEVVRNAQLAPAGPIPAGFRYGKAATNTSAQTGFQFGPVSPPLGEGSYRISTPDSAAKGQVLSLLPTGDRLASLTALTYSTYIRQLGIGDNRQVPAINIQIDFNGPNVSGGFATLVWEPVYQPTDNGTPATNTWQQRDAVAGGQAVYYSTRAIGGQPRFTGVADLRTLDFIVANNPDATIDFIAINQGGGNPGLDANVDAFRIQSGGDDVTADLEPDVPMLDTYRATKGTGPTITASGDLVTGREYTVTVKGTNSVFARSLMATTPTRGWAICGTPENGPLFESPAIQNGRVGSDPEFLFSYPQQATKCSASNQRALPVRQSALSFSTNGTTFTKPTTTTPGTTPTTDHTYTYSVIGQGRPLQARFTDSNYADNYGQYRITVAPTIGDA